MTRFDLTHPPSWLYSKETEFFFKNRTDKNRIPPVIVTDLSRPSMANNKGEDIR